MKTRDQKEKPIPEVPVSPPEENPEPEPLTPSTPPEITPAPEEPVVRPQQPEKPDKIFRKYA